MKTENAPPAPQYRNLESANVPARVTVVDFDMSFGHLVVFFVKAAIAAIPAAIILAVLAAVLVAVLGGLFGGIGAFR